MWRNCMQIYINFCLNIYKVNIGTTLYNLIQLQCVTERGPLNPLMMSKYPYQLSTKVENSPITFYNP